MYTCLASHHVRIFHCCNDAWEYDPFHRRKVEQIVLDRVLDLVACQSFLNPLWEPSFIVEVWMPSVLDPISFSPISSIIMSITGRGGRKLAAQVLRYYVWGLLPIKKSDKTMLCTISTVRAARKDTSCPFPKPVLKLVTDFATATKEKLTHNTDLPIFNVALI